MIEIPTSAVTELIEQLEKLVQHDLENDEPKALGYQVVDKVTGELPDEFWSFQVLSEKVANDFVANDENPDRWKIHPVFDGDVEEAEFID